MFCHCLKGALQEAQKHTWICPQSLYGWMLQWRFLSVYEITAPVHVGCEASSCEVWAPLMISCSLTGVPDLEDMLDQSALTGCLMPAHMSHKALPA